MSSGRWSGPTTIPLFQDAADPLGDLPLKQAEIEPPAAEMVADRARCAWVGFWRRFSS
jgi:acetoacetate decarboxylase